MRFPQMHIATSVVNRVLDLADREMIIAQSQDPMPKLPDTAGQSDALDAALSAPVPAIPAPEGSAEAVAIETQQGGTAADAVGGMAVLDTLA